MRTALRWHYHIQASAGSAGVVQSTASPSSMEGPDLVRALLCSRKRVIPRWSMGAIPTRTCQWNRPRWYHARRSRECDADYSLLTHRRAYTNVTHGGGIAKSLAHIAAAMPYAAVSADQYMALAHMGSCSPRHVCTVVHAASSASCMEDQVSVLRATRTRQRVSIPRRCMGARPNRHVSTGYTPLVSLDAVRGNGVQVIHGGVGCRLNLASPPRFPSSRIYESDCEL